MALRKLKVLHAPTSTGGNPQGLSRALEKLGVESRSLVVSQNYIAYPSDIVLHWPGQNLIVREFRRFFAIFFLLPKFDVIHYNSGTTVASAFAFQFSLGQGVRGVLRLSYAAYLRGLQRVELLWLRLLRKRIFVTYQGDDARQGDYIRAHFPINIATQVDEKYYSAKSDEFKRRNILDICSRSEAVYSLNPDLLHVLPPKAQFVPYSHIFLDEWMPAYNEGGVGPLRIAHAPSNRRVKGTDIILAALDGLRTEGLQFELLLVEGVNNSQAREIYSSADVLIDQLFAGWYGGLAVELMALGKPVISYIREGDLGYIPEAMRQDLPVIQITPDSVEQVLRRVLKLTRADLVALGRRSRAYVEKWHDPLQIAARIKADYERAPKRRS